jgi:hypothetical protein
MALHTAKLFEYTLNTGVGTQTITETFDKFDLSRARAVIGKLTLTKADTDAGDLLDVYFEERTNTLTWNQRARFEQVLGSGSPTATDPEERTIVVSADVNLDTTEESYEDTGSLGGTALSAGTVRNGPFAGKLYSSGAPVATHRMRVVVTDADNDADFEGTVAFYAVTEV